MIVETVKVYKGQSDVTVNKTDVEEWNERGYMTSSQQKKAAEDAKQKKELEEAEKKKAAEDAEKKKNAGKAD